MRQPLDVAKMNYDSAKIIDALEAVKVASRPATRDVVSISVMRNEMLRLPDFLRHHRKLGVARFAIVDNASTDGTSDYLAEQPDVDLWRTTEPYSSRSRVLWLNALAHHMDVGRWCLIVDADEQLVYDGCDKYDLNDLTNFLDRNNLPSLPCLMLDMYGDRPMKQMVVGPSERLIDVCPYFDGEGYRFDFIKKGKAYIRKITNEGGPRNRLLSTPSSPFVCMLGKTPLAKRGRMTALVHSHRMYPSNYNNAPVNGCLLHFKFLADFHSRVTEAVDKGQYSLGSREYKRYFQLLQTQPDVNMVFSGSRRYFGPECLVKAELMTPLWTHERMTGEST